MHTNVHRLGHECHAPLAASQFSLLPATPCPPSYGTGWQAQCGYRYSHTKSGAEGPPFMGRNTWQILKPLKVPGITSTGRGPSTTGRAARGYTLLAEHPGFREKGGESLLRRGAKVPPLGVQQQSNRILDMRQPSACKASRAAHNDSKQHTSPQVCRATQENRSALEEAGESHCPSGAAEKQHISGPVAVTGWGGERMAWWCSATPPVFLQWKGHL